MAKLLDGTTAQSGHVRNSGDYSHERINYPVLGVVLNLYPSDDAANNKSAIATHNGRGTRWEAEVLILNDGMDSYWTVQNAVILPNGPTGIDDFCEELPRPCSQMIDGSKFKSSMASIDPSKLDGDVVIVQFLGGKITQPIITGWFPHPSNFTDSSTQGFKEGTLAQGKRVLKRNNGVEMAITPAGSVYLDTNKSGSSVIGSESGPSRKLNARGGDVKVNVKPGRTCEVNFNPSVPTPTTEPSLPQKNPPDPASPRETANSRMTLTKDDVEAVAGQVVRIIAKQLDIVLSPAGNLYMGDEGDADENMVLGQVWKSLMTRVLTALSTHTHPTGTGPSGPPIQASSFSDEIADLPDCLSDFIFGQKVSPTGL